MPVDILRPRTWVRYDPKNCLNCYSGCCTLPLRVDSEDLHHMGFLPADQVNGSKLKIAKRLKKQGIIRSYNQRSELFTIRRHANNDCIFLDKDRRCSIYDRRPFVCRSYPEYSVRPGFCPYRAKKEVVG